MLNINNISITFNASTPNEVKALDKVSLEIKEGSFVCILGTNGSGKSTLLNMVAGNFIPDQGQNRTNYEDQVIKTFPLSHADPQEMKTIVDAILAPAAVAGLLRFGRCAPCAAQTAPKPGNPKGHFYSSEIRGHFYSRPTTSARPGIPAVAQKRYNYWVLRS